MGKTMESKSLKNWKESVSIYNKEIRALRSARESIEAVMTDHILSIFSDAKSVSFSDDFSRIVVDFGYYSNTLVDSKKLSLLGIDLEITVGKDIQLYDVVSLVLYPFGKKGGE